MKTFLECTEEAARENKEHGFNHWLMFKLDEQQLEYLERAAVIYAQSAQLQQHGVVQGLPYYQLCPKCFGEGYVHSIGSTSSLHRICPVCNGAKTLYHALSGSPAVGREGGQSSD